MENDQSNASVEMKKDQDGLYSVRLETADDGLYKLYRTDESSQLMIPFYLPADGPQDILRFQQEADGLTLPLNDDNRAPSAYNAFIMRSSRRLWSEGKEMTSEQLKTLLQGYEKEVSRLLNQYDCAAPVRSYL